MVVTSSGKNPFYIKNMAVELAKLACSGNLKELREKIENGEQFDAILYENSKDNLAHVAARNGHVLILKYLQEKYGTNYFELTNFDGKTALHEAAQNGHLQCVKFLVMLGVNIDALKRADWTPLMLSCAKSNLDVVKTLVEFGAELNLVNKDGWNSFHIACREGYMNIITYLLNKDVDQWKNRSKNGRSPLHTAALHGKFDVVRFLLENGFFLENQTDSCGSTPFMDSLRSGQVETAKIFMKYHSIDLRQLDANKRQIIHIVAETGGLNSLKFLIEGNKVCFDEKTKFGNTPLHFACREGHFDVVNYLLSLNADVSVTDIKGRNALNFAAAQHSDIITALILNKIPQQT